MKRRDMLSAFGLSSQYQAKFPEIAELAASDNWTINEDGGGGAGER